MSLESDLYAYLSTHAALTSVVGTRIYPAPLPQACSLPALTYSRISTATMYSHGGDSALDAVRLQFDCWATSHTDVIALAAALRAALTGKIASLGVCFLDADRDVYEPETGYRRRIMEIIIWREEN